MRERYIEEEVTRFIREAKRLLNTLEIVLNKSPPNPDRDEVRKYALAIANALETEIRELRYSLLLGANVVTIDLTLADSSISMNSLTDTILGMIKANDAVLLEHMSDGEVAYTTPPNTDDLSRVIAEKLTAKLLPEDIAELTAMEMAQSGYYLIKIVGPTPNSVRYYLAKPGSNQ
jgi:hypothetical protein